MAGGGAGTGGVGGGGGAEGVITVEGESGVVEVPVLMGRSVKLKRAANGVVLLQFDELCGRPLGSADYLALAEGFHTVLLHGVPCIYTYVYICT